MSTTPASPLTVPIGRRQLLLAAGALVLAACGSSTTSSTTTPTTADTGPTDPGPTGTGSGDTPGTNVTPGTVRGSTLWIPPLLTGPEFDLTIAPSSTQWFEGTPTATTTYNGAEFWGPTLLMRRGDHVTLHVTNGLDDETTTHWHGFHIPAEMDGGPHQVIAAGETWSPSFEVKNLAATYWYHPHMHETTWQQMNLGAGGLIIVQDDDEAALALPRTYGVDDVPLVLTSRKFVDDNAIDTAGIYGDVMLTNGVMAATVELPAQLVRFRILNAEIERAYDLGFADGRTFHVIGTDGGLVNTPVPMTRLVMAPGERYEIVVDLAPDGAGGAVTMQAFNGGQAFGFPGGEPQTSGQFGSLLNDTTFDVLRIGVVDATADAITELPDTLADHTSWTADDAVNVRSIAITDEGPGTPFTFDDMAYDMDTVAQTVVLDSIERWEITNGRTFSHSFHIHDVQFSLVSRSTGPVGEHEKGWKDTVYVFKDEVVSFVAKFDDFASTEHPFMYHCHMANHEDEGLMGQFLVVPS